MSWIVRETRIVHLPHGGLACQEPSQLESVLILPFHPENKGLETAFQEETGVWIECSTQMQLQLPYRLDPLVRPDHDPGDDV